MREIELRPAEPRDLLRLTEIYNHYVRTAAVTFDIEPATLDARREWMSHYHARGRHRLIVAVENERVLGYASSGPWRAKPAYQTTVETSVYCSADATGRGVGSLLYARLFAVLASEDVRRAVAGVALPNEPSIRLHARCGFREVGTFTQVGRKFGRYWDVLWMERSLGDP